MKRKIKRFLLMSCTSAFLLGLASCAGTSTSQKITPLEESLSAIESVLSSEKSGNSSEETAPMRTGIISEQVLEGETGTIHYSYYLPENYDGRQKYPLMLAMPGYDMMWFGEGSSGANLNWSGFLCWTQLPEDMIVVSAQLTDWHETSARQAIELTEYFIDHFSVDHNRVYAAGYSAGGETMSQAISMRPDLYAAYLHGASQWDGEFVPVAENGVAVFIFMAKNDEYYGSERAVNAYNSLRTAYENAGWTADEMDIVLQIQTPDNEWFAERGVTGNYHGGGNVVFDETNILKWIVAHDKGEK
jgi:predicted peptidase